ncbi:hypothetical protein BC938DRAFT_477161 [Jimgerdemannia flammicorona]|uniref:Uncharacterized protein n=1 Tax=Jimgerdemannia flammicorona TaxID=994334 RepID=A0A433PBN0_9FUNG|nr:hypothetical protein BC938DRAFT_477161 [Jimgerdemannia flammicorona]
MSVDPSQKKRFLGQTILSFLLSEKGYANFQWRTKLRNALPTQNATPVSVLPTCDEYREWMRRYVQPPIENVRAISSFRQILTAPYLHSPHAPVPHQNDERPGLATSARILLHPLHCSHPECLPAATRAGVRGFIGGYSTMVLVHVVLPAVIYRNMRTATSSLSLHQSHTPSPHSLRTFLCNLTHSSPSLSFAVFVSAFSFLYKILLRSLTLHPITSYNPLLPPFTAALLASPTLLLDTASPYRRISIALYIATKTSQFVYQAAQEKGLVPSMPFWCGRWLLFAVSSAQMIWCFLNDPESFPPSYNKFIVTRSSTYVPRRPKGWTGATWPTGAEIVQGIRVISDAGFPAFDREKALQMGGPMDNLRPVIESADDGVCGRGIVMLRIV